MVADRVADAARPALGRCGARVEPDHGTAWTPERLRRTVRRLVAAKIVEPELLDPAPRKPAADRLVVLVAGIASAAPDRTLQQIASQLEGMREPTPRAGTRWHAPSVRHLLRRAERLGLPGAPSPAPSLGGSPVMPAATFSGRRSHILFFAPTGVSRSRTPRIAPTLPSSRARPRVVPSVLVCLARLNRLPVQPGF